MQSVAEVCRIVKNMSAMAFAAGGGMVSRSDSAAERTARAAAPSISQQVNISFLLGTGLSCCECCRQINNCGLGQVYEVLHGSLNSHMQHIQAVAVNVI